MRFRRLPGEAWDSFESLPPIPVPLLCQTAACQQAGDRDGALRLLREALACAPLDPGLRLQAVHSYQALGEETEAVLQTAVVLALEPHSFGAHSTLARIAAARGDTEGARELLATGWEFMEPLLPRRERAGAAERYFRLAALGEASGRVPDPIESIAAAFRAGTRSAWWWLLRRGQFRECHRLRLERSYAAARLMEILPPLVEASNRAEAESRLMELVAADPASGLVRLFACECYQALGNALMALLQVAVALGGEPAFWPVRPHLAHILRARGDEPTAERVLEIGWAQCRHGLPRQEWEKERKSFFAPLAGERLRIDPPGEGSPG